MGTPVLSGFPKFSFILAQKLPIDESHGIEFRYSPAEIGKNCLISQQRQDARDAEPVTPLYTIAYSKAIPTKLRSGIDKTASPHYSTYTAMMAMVKSREHA